MMNLKNEHLRQGNNKCKCPEIGICLGPVQAMRRTEWCENREIPGAARVNRLGRAW